MPLGCTNVELMFLLYNEMANTYQLIDVNMDAIFNYISIFATLIQTR